ncbi:slipin family protein [Enterorhabdus sp. P55]|uniref:slipin family protein n=1 Tax=Enterorhabdus sp. P55 TaxID=2304571 RepID=UPI00136D9766|nr:slipin family protein [Enterorhabdus sp. P55]MCI8451379.1 slipin family protein [Eggerthellaceae bacterium]NBI32480.1 slipin family protein [Enterorhabdus sp. P55]
MRRRTRAAADESSSSPAQRTIQSNVQLETGRRRTSRNGAAAFTVVVFLLAAALVCAVAEVVGGMGVAAIVTAVIVGVLAASSVHVVMEWEKAVVMRFGKFNRVAGPGLVFTWPLIEFYTLRVDQRVIATYFGAEETLTSDLVPVNVDAVVFWMVFSAKKAAIEVEDYASAVSWMSQAMLRKAIGRATLSEVATRRDQLDAELKDVLEEKLADWGIAVMDVEVRDIVVPKELQSSMAAEAVATRERNARMIMAEAERDISEMLRDASEVYDGDAEALRLRTMHLAYESVKQSGGTVVIPSAFSEGFTGAPEDAERAARAVRPAEHPTAG